VIEDVAGPTTGTGESAVPESRRALLVRQNHLNACEAIHRYIAAGGPAHVETKHGPRPEDNEIVFTIHDWDAFVRVLQQDSAQSA
jgi:hypothetical protein